MSPEILTIQDCMTRVMADVREVGKTGRNTQQNYSFRGVDTVVNAVAPALRAHGVIVLPRLEHVEYVDFLSGQKQTPMIGCRVIVHYEFVGPGGDKLVATVPGEAMDSGDKATAKAMSVAFRIALLQALALPTDDVDPDASSYENVRAAGMSPPATAASGESTAVLQDGAQATPVASPDTSVPTGAEQEAPGKPDDAAGEGATTTDPGASTPIDKVTQDLLVAAYDGKIEAIKVAKKRYGPQITKLANLSQEQADELLEKVG